MNRGLEHPLRVGCACLLGAGGMALEPGRGFKETKGQR